MDLPTCPACGQSVLDDDAEDCPFCGASMTGKPKAAPAPAKAKTAPAPGKTAPSKPTAGGEKAAPASRAAAGGTKSAPKQDDDPFAVDRTSAEKAVRLASKPAKGRTWKVVCPMCETAGYTAPKAAGQEVRCANPECLVPVFTAPKPEKKPQPQETGRTGPSKWIVGSVAGVVLVAIGVWVWFLFFREEPPTSLPGDYRPAQSSGPAENGKDEQGHAADRTDEQPDKQEPTTIAEIRAKALQAMEEASKQRNRNRSKPFCRRLTAAAFAVHGDLDGARGQLAQMDRLSLQIPYYRVPPLVEIGWQQMAAGDRQAALETLEEALSASDDLPDYGRDRLGIATLLASALAAADRSGDARTLLEQNRETSPLGQLSAELIIARSLGSYNVDHEARRGPIHGYASPQSTAVTIDLLGRGKPDEALAWARALPEEGEARSDAITAWAVSAVRLSTGIDGGRIDEAALALPPADRARLYARVAQQQLAAEDVSGAEQSLGKARDLLAGIEDPAEYVLPDMKGFFDSELRERRQWKPVVLAAAETARGEARRGRSQEAWKLVQRALRFSRAMTPSPEAVSRRNDEIADFGVGEMRRRLREALSLSSNDAARLKFNDYRRTLGRLQQAAEGRFQLQSTILSAAVEWGLAAQVWNEIDDRRYRPDDNQREPWLQTDVPWMLLDAFRKAEQQEQAKAVLAALDAARQKPSPRWEMVRQAAAQLDQGSPARAADVFNRYSDRQTGEGVRDRWRLRLACRLAADGRLQDALKFVNAFASDEVVIREDAYRMIGALAAHNGRARAVWEAGQGSALTPTEMISLYRGLFDAAVKSPDAGTAGARTGASTLGTPR